MILGSGLSLWKILGLFGICLMLIIWGGGIAIGIAKAARTGDWKEALTSTGGKIFSIDKALQDETNYLLDNEDPAYQNIFHLAYSISLLFMIFFIAVILFKFFSWVMGIHAFSPSSDIIIILIIIGIFLLSEFLYSYFILGTTLVPLKDGIFYFIRNLPTILNKMTI